MFDRNFRGCASATVQLVELAVGGSRATNRFLNISLQKCDKHIHFPCYSEYEKYDYICWAIIVEM